MERSPIKKATRRTVPWGPPEERLLARARDDDDRHAMEELVQRMLPLARALACRYPAPADHREDLMQVAGIALFRALQRFDPGRGVPFPTYAVPTIIGHLNHYHRDHCWSVKVPRSVQERALVVKRESSRLSSKLGRSPTPAELAASCGLPVEDALEARIAADAYSAVSLDAPQDPESTGPATAPSSEDPAYRHIEDADALRPVLGVLPQRERWILALRFGEDLPQHEIAHRIGMSQMHVSRLMRRALDRVGPILAEAY